MSNKTPKAAVKKTKSALKFLIAALILLIAFFVIFGALVDKTDVPNTSQPLQSECTYIKNQCFVVERADTNEKRVKGLSNRESLPTQNAMVFVFDTPDNQCFWMKGMKFAIDMIWLNENKEIIKIESNVTPETYPKSFCAENTKYVIEINTGLANNLGLRLGDKIDL